MYYDLHVQRYNPSLTVNIAACWVTLTDTEICDQQLYVSCWSIRGNGSTGLCFSFDSKNHSKVYHTPWSGTYSNTNLRQKRFAPDIWCRLLSICEECGSPGCRHRGKSHGTKVFIWTTEGKLWVIGVETIAKTVCGLSPPSIDYVWELADVILSWLEPDWPSISRPSEWRFL